MKSHLPSLGASESVSKGHRKEELEVMEGCPQVYKELIKYMLLRNPKPSRINLSQMNSRNRNILLAVWYQLLIGICNLLYYQRRIIHRSEHAEKEQNRNRSRIRFSYSTFARVQHTQQPGHLQHFPWYNNLARLICMITTGNANQKYHSKRDHIHSFNIRRPHLNDKIG